MKVHRTPARWESERRRVAAYCRVSTAGEAQEESFETQVRYYTRVIRANPNWTLVRVYADRGISGTSVENRPAFQRMLLDAAAGEMDLILVKSISRFARDLVACQRCVAALKAQNVEVRFEREGISSFDPAGEFIFSLLSAVAQDESRSISENVKWGYRRRFARGAYCLGNNRLLGYDTDPETKKLVPNADAWIVRLAFERFNQGVPYRKIAGELNAMGAKRLRGKTPLSASTIQSIIANETYAGDKRLQKKPPQDFLTKRSDPGAAYKSYYLKDDHEAIIDRETWLRAQAILQARREDARRGVHKGGRPHHVFYGKLFCGACGEAYTRRTRAARAKEQAAREAVWSCRDRLKGAAGRGCKGRTVREAALERAITEQMGWPAFDAARFEAEVARVEVLEDALRVVREKR